MSIRLRLTLWYSGIVALTLLVFGGVLYFTLQYFIMGSIKDSLKNYAVELRPNARYDFNWDDLRVSADGFGRVRNDQYIVQIVNYYNGGIGQSPNISNSGYKIPYPKKAEDAKEEFFRTNFGEYPLIVYNFPIPINNVTVGLLQVGVISETTDNFFKILVNVLISVSVLTVLIAFTLGMFLARKALQPIDSVIAAAKQIEKSTDLDNRILYDGPNDEIGRLVSTLNSMMSRIETIYNELDDAYTAQRRFVSDASHELRTPLTTIRGNVDLLEKMWANAAAQIDMSDESKKEMSLEAMRDIADEARRMSRLVNDMLSLARADAGQTMEKVPVELKPLVEEVVRRAQFLPRKADWITGDLSALDGVTVQGNKDYLQQLLFIFIENGFKYTPQGYVKLDALMRGGQIGIRISDTGIGMDKGEVPHIFERFYRADVSRGVTAGTGLGLSIAKWIIDEHGGSIEVMTRKDEGSIFVIWLPVGFQLNAP